MYINPHNIQTEAAASFLPLFLNAYKKQPIHARNQLLCIKKYAFVKLLSIHPFLNYEIGDYHNQGNSQSGIKCGIG